MTEQEHLDFHRKFVSAVNEIKGYIVGVPISGRNWENEIRHSVHPDGNANQYISEFDDFFESGSRCRYKLTLFTDAAAGVVRAKLDHASPDIFEDYVISRDDGPDRMVEYLHHVVWSLKQLAERLAKELRVGKQ